MLRNKEILKIILISCIFLFIAWISFFDQTLQLRYKNITLIFLSVFCFLSFLYRDEFRFSKEDIALFTYLFAVTLTIAFSENRSVALEWYRLYILPIPLVYFAARNLDKRFILPIAIGFLIFSSIVALFGIFEIIFRRNIIYEFWVENMYYYRHIYISPRIMSALMHPTVFGTYLLGSLPFSLLLLSKAKRPYRVFIIIAILISIIGIIFSFSRGVLAGFIGSSIAYFYFTKRMRYFKFLILGMLALVLFSSVALKNEFRFDRFSLAGILDERRFASKMQSFGMTLDILKEAPLLGIGLNHYRLKFDKYFGEGYKQWEERLKRTGIDPDEKRITDNMYLSILSETGLIGFFSFIFFLFLLFKRTLGHLGIVKDAVERRFLIASFCGVTGLLISMNTYDMLYWINPLFLFWFLIGALRAVGSDA